MEIEAFTCICKKRQTSPFLYLIVKGQVGLYTELPEGGEASSWKTPLGIYEDGWFACREALTHTPANAYSLTLKRTEVLAWSQRDWYLMKKEWPVMAAELSLLSALSAGHLVKAHMHLNRKAAPAAPAP